MAKTFYAQHGSNATQGFSNRPWLGGCEASFDECVGMESGTAARHVNTFQLSMESIRKHVMARHGQSAMDAIAVGDFIELYTVPTYASVEDFALHHDLKVEGFKFEVEMVDRVADPAGSCGATIDTVRDPLEAVHDTERETTVKYGDAPAPMEEVDLAESGRDHWHFENKKYRNNHHAVLRLKVTAVPPVPEPDSPTPWVRIWDMDMDFFATFHRYAVCTCKRTGVGAYEKPLVDTIEGA
jgi:hypothetical protein